MIKSKMLFYIRKYVLFFEKKNTYKQQYLFKKYIINEC